MLVLAALWNNPSWPDVVEGVDLIVADWEDTCTAAGCNYLNTAGFVRVPVSATTNATLRPGTYIHDMARGPSSLNAHSTFAKSFDLGGGCRVQVRFEAFNVLNKKNYNSPNQVHQQLELRQNHGRRRKPLVPTWRSHDVLARSLRPGGTPRDRRGRPRRSASYVS